jgi:hypothetical protein
MLAMMLDDNLSSGFDSWTSSVSFSSYNLIDYVISFLQINDIDTSKAESRSEAEDNDIASLKTVKGYSHLSLTPIRDEVSVDVVFC